MDLHHHSYRPNHPPHLPSNQNHIPHTPPHSHRRFHPQQHRPTLTVVTATASFPRQPSPPLSSLYPLVYSPSESSSMSFAEFDLSQNAFLNHDQLPWSESRSKFQPESSPASQPVFYADSGSYAFYNDSNGNPAIDTQLFTSQPQPQIFAGAPQPAVYFSPFAENELQ